LIDILPPDASKGVAVEKLAALNNLRAENVMVMGDNFNDLEMLEYAGTAVLMGNSLPELLERDEFHTTLSNDENGVALAIEKFIL
jgi:hydroxymethylpyrimidine pyrophosphatase-like HAD family hydrolase